MTTQRQHRPETILIDVDETDQKEVLRVKIKTDSISVNRDTYLDGVRGWASMTVIIYHFLDVQNAWSWLFTKPTWDYFFMGSPLSLLVDGPRAVHVFFILSGRVLAVSMIRGESTNIAAAIVRRPFRLGFPIFVAFCEYVRSDDRNDR